MEARSEARKAQPEGATREARVWRLKLTEARRITPYL